MIRNLARILGPASVFWSMTMLIIAWLVRADSSMQYLSQLASDYRAGIYYVAALTGTAFLGFFFYRYYLETLSNSRLLRPIWITTVLCYIVLLLFPSSTDSNLIFGLHFLFTTILFLSWMAMMILLPPRGLINKIYLPKAVFATAGIVITAMVAGWMINSNILLVQLTAVTYYYGWALTISLSDHSANK